MSGIEVVVAVLTYRRPEELGEALDALTGHLASARAPARLLVVDNDVEPSACDVVARFPGARYVHEPRPGIAAARNRALDEADAARLVVFIDDDERPQPGWLDALVDSWQRSRPAAVVGAVVSTFAVPPDPWIEAGAFFSRARHATGTEVSAAATNNLLLDLDVVRSVGLRFDERFGISGGSDTFFTRSLVRGGGRIVWCDEAVVLDMVPADRLTRSWVLKRYQRMGNSGSRVDVLLARPGADRLLTRGKLIGQALVRVVVGGLRAAYGKLTGNLVHHARGARLMARGRGMLAGAVGGVVVEYGRSERPGSPRRARV